MTNRYNPGAVIPSYTTLGVADGSAQAQVVTGWKYTYVDRHRDRTIVSDNVYLTCTQAKAAMRHRMKQLNIFIGGYGV
jgi:hypothetical protein